MSRPHASRPGFTSLIDRLARAAGPGAGPVVADLEEIRAGVVRDLEWLLNTRRTPGELDAPLDSSLLAFGIPDLTTAPLDELRARLALRDALTEAIRRFEPRLMDVRVEVDPACLPDRRLRFRIVARLRVDPDPEPFCVEPMLDLTTRAFVL